MDTEILKASDFFLAVDGLKRGEPVVFPTETVYGLAAPLFNEEAIRRIFSIKGRPLDNPLIAHISSLEEAGRLSQELPDSFYTLAEHFWPGPLTIVVKRHPKVPALVSAGHPSIAIRMPSHPIARLLIQEVGEPFVAPSANLSGRPSPTCVRDVLEDLSGKVRYIIDGGDCEIGIESTVISLFQSVPTLLRPGKITRENLEEVLGVKVALPTQNEPVFSPGMKYRHYAPKAKVELVYQKEAIQGSCVIYPTMKNLYAQLREADRKGASKIEVYCDPSTQNNAGLMNRLLRASGQIV